MRCRNTGAIIATTALLLGLGCSNPSRQDSSVRMWMTTADRSQLLAEQAILPSGSELSDVAIDIDTTVSYQTMDGFGYALTGGSAMVLKTKLTDEARANLLRELFLTEGNGIGVSYLRISIGASDLDERVFSYDDMPSGKTDPSLSHFTLAYDTLYLIPLLKEILKLNPSLTIMASPWSPPAWMKTNHQVKAGSLRPEYYTVYANYLSKYIQEMANEGIRIDAITIQNEPENPNNTPSLLMTAVEQSMFIQKHLGPTFQTLGIKTKIVLFDHNCDHPEYPISILDDPGTKPFVDGSAFHLYLGEISALSKVHEAHPDKNIYFTEQWTWSKGRFEDDLRWHVRNLVVGASRHWSRTVLEWNLASDENFDPHTDDGGCDSCQGALTIGDSIVRNVSYYIIAHAAKFVPPGSVRISSTVVDRLENVAFRTPDGQIVLIVVNDNTREKTFSIRTHGRVTTSTLPAGAVSTFVWK
jgi:glucosylceramidase